MHYCCYQWKWIYKKIFKQFQNFLFNISYCKGFIKRLLHDIFHIGPGISQRLPCQARQRSWRADMGRGLIPGTIWKISCHYLFITYFTLTFFKHWLLYCIKDLWTDKLRKWILKRVAFVQLANIFVSSFVQWR